MQRLGLGGICSGSVLALAILAACGKGGAPCEPSPQRPAAPARHFATRFGIANLDRIVRATGLTTAVLGRRAHDDEIEYPGDVRVITRCGANWCTDGLVAGPRTLIPPVLSGDEARTLSTDDGYFTERVLRVAWSDQRYVSVYVAESEFSGGAHANNSLGCRTFDRAAGRELSLAEVLPPRSAALLLAKSQTLLEDANAAIDAGFDGLTDWAHYRVNARGFRFADSPGDSPAILLCAEGVYPLASDSILEIDPEAIPIRFLLR